MRTLSLSLLGAVALVGAPALAGGELQLKSNTPVILVLDGETIGTVQPLEPILVDITPGVHNLRLQGLLGKDLYDRDLIFDDNTRTELHWQRKELRLGQVVALDPQRPDEAVADAGPPEAPPAPAAAPEAPVAPPAVAAAPPAPPPPAPPPPAPVAAAPVAPAPPPVAAAPPPAPAPPPVVAAAPPPPPAVAPAPPRRTTASDTHAPRSGSVVIQATENLDLRIVNGTQQLRVRVVDGELVVVDARGTEVRFPAGDGW